MLEKLKHLEKTWDQVTLEQQKPEIPVRDCLAVERTVLANQRTFLAFLRTALTLFAAGVTFIQFFDSVWLTWLGWLFIPASIILVIMGSLSYKKMRGAIAGIESYCPLSKRKD
ncbi:MAG: DUF202 domain-containing protein [Desulfobacca sp.]|nr:DUF202 domain-containing protein [Desulfobacca sp.]